MKKKYFINNPKVYFIAEIGINHNGEVKNALKLIEEAKSAGCDAVKFQKKSPKISTPKHVWDNPKDTPWGKMTYIEYKERMEFNKKQYREIIKFCNKLKIDWSASCWDIKSVDFMESLRIPYYKVASASITDLALLKRIKKTKKPVIISTGMSTMGQINRIITKLKKIFPKSIIGYSGHEKGLSSTVAAAVLDAKIIERHITLDKAMWGTDQLASIESMGYARIIRDTRIIEKSLGEPKKVVFKSEYEVMKKLRPIS